MLVALVLFIFAILVLAAWATRHVAIGFLAEQGRTVSIRSQAYREQRLIREEVARLSRDGAEAPDLIATVGGDTARKLREQMRAVQGPSAHGRPLVQALLDGRSELHGRRAFVVVAGRDSDQEVRLLGASVGHEMLPYIQAVPATSSGEKAADRAANMQSAVVGAVREAAEAAANAGAGSFVALIVAPPVTGTWRAEQELDLGELFEQVDAACDEELWISVREPGRIGAWPDDLVVGLPRDVLRVIREYGKASSAFSPLLSAEAGIALSGEAAARLTVELVGSQEVALRDGGQAAYSASIALSVSAHTPGESGYSLVQDDQEAVIIDSFLSAIGLELRTREGSGIIVPRPGLPQTAIARRAARSAGTKPSEGPARASDSALRWLAEAAADQDAGVCSAVLAEHGRAWLERADPLPAIAVLKRVQGSFPVSSLPYLWSNALLAIDSALRLGEPDAGWFGDEVMEAAEGSPLEPLYYMERIEFQRLRGDLRGAVAEANQILARLDGGWGPREFDPYAAGTARYVFANLLRMGGRYDLAHKYVGAAISMLDASVPSHRIELTHAVYARSVCDSMAGVSSVSSPPGKWSDQEAVFARSLVTLSNCHAAWFIGDYERAVEFARAAKDGFESIGYERYVSRSLHLLALLSEWAERSHNPVGSATPLGLGALYTGTVRQLLSESLVTPVECLRDERPSRALGYLQFVEAFGRPDVAVRVDMPLVVRAGGGTLGVHRPEPAMSMGEAASRLRDELGVGQVRTPLYPD